MKKLILCFIVMLLSACSTANHIITPLPPNDALIKSGYRKTKEVIMIDCQQRDRYIRIYTGTTDGYGYNLKTVKDKESVSIVETTDTGERFEVYGCFGRIGDRFKISY